VCACVQDSRFQSLSATGVVLFVAAQSCKLSGVTLDKTHCACPGAVLTCTRHIPVPVCRDPFDHSMMGTVGLPLPGVDMRLEAVPELGYLPNDPKTPRGEVGVAGCMLLQSSLLQYASGTNSHHWTCTRPCRHRELCQPLSSLRFALLSAPRTRLGRLCTMRTAEHGTDTSSVVATGPTPCQLMLLCRSACVAP
jgi:hypothetical protein